MQRLPQRWNRFFFTRTSLRKCRLRVQLGHAQHECCPEATPLHRDFVVLHTNGIHKVAVDICDCEHKNSAGSAEDQMLRAGWFPVTDMRARTCAMFSCLDLFILSMHQAKTTMYDFYAMLEKLTDNMGVKPPNRYPTFIRMSREYRHLLMLKRTGQAHEPTGVAGTQLGELAVLCPCCPDPAVNLPEGWNDVCAEDQ